MSEAHGTDNIFRVAEICRIMFIYNVAMLEKTIKIIDPLKQHEVYAHSMNTICTAFISLHEQMGLLIPILKDLEYPDLQKYTEFYEYMNTYVSRLKLQPKKD